MNYTELKLRKITRLSLWVIKEGPFTLVVLDENDMKSLAKQFKEAGF
jgi:hypothetical protein